MEKEKTRIKFTLPKNDYVYMKLKMYVFEILGKTTNI